MIYLDNAATSAPKAPGVAEAISRHLSEIANPGRSGHRRAVAAEEMIERCRAKIARIIGARDADRVILTLNCTDGLSTAILGVIARAPGTPHVITTVLEHDSVTRPLNELSAAGRITLTRLDCDAEGFVSVNDVVAALGADTVLVAFLHASNAVGTVQPAAEICRAVRERSDALVLLDAAQTIGVLPIDVETLGADLVAFPGHKALMGPTGTGALYVGPRVFPDDASIEVVRIAPLRVGATAGDSITPTQPCVLPLFLESGTPNTVGLAGLEAGLDWVLERDSTSVVDHERELVGRLIERLGGRDDVRIVGTRDTGRRIGALSLVFDNEDPAEVGRRLDEGHDIAARPGLHCAPDAHRAMGTYPRGTLRLSPGPFNTIEEIDTACEAIESVLGTPRGAPSG